MGARRPTGPEWTAIDRIAQIEALAFSYAKSGRALTGDLEVSDGAPVAVATFLTVTRQTVLGKPPRSAPAPKSRGRWQAG